MQLNHFFDTGTSGNYYADNSWANVFDQIFNGGAGQANYDIGLKNLEYQKENLDYQKALQEEIFNREDTSYQRTVEDMRNAGLNPLTMSGTNGAGEAIATNPIQNNTQVQGVNPLAILSQIFQVANSLQDWQIGQSKNRESAALASIAESNAYIAGATAEDKIADSNMSKFQKSLMTSDLWRNELFNREFNIFNGMDEKTKYIQMLKEYIGQGEHNWAYYDDNLKDTMVNHTKGLYVSGNWKDQSAKGDIEQSIANFSEEIIKKMIGAIDFGKEKGTDILKKILGL